VTAPLSVGERFDPGARSVRPSARSFLTLEITIRKRLERRWLDQVARPAQRRIRRAVARRDFDAARDAARAISFDPVIEGQEGFLRTMALSAVVLGASFFSGDASDTVFVDGGVPEEAEIAASALFGFLQDGAAERVREEALRLIDAVEAAVAADRFKQDEIDVAPETPAGLRRALQSIAEPSPESRPPIVASPRDFATRLNRAVARGGIQGTGIGANLSTSRLIQFGALAQAEAQGEQSYQITEILDDRTCPFCRGMHGKVFEVAPAQDRLFRQLRETDPLALKSAFPFPSTNQAAIAAFSRLSNDQLRELGHDTPPYHPWCLPGDARVATCGPIAGESRRWFDGQVVVVDTARGNHLRSTPNHPVLTDRGWVAAGSLDEGDRVVECRGVQGPERRLVPEHQDVPPTAEQVFEALRRSSGVTTREVPGTPEYFHGDGRHGEVDVVRADRFLGHDAGHAAVFEFSHHGAFQVAATRALFARLRALAEGFDRVARAARGAMGGFGLTPAFAFVHALPACPHGVAPAAHNAGGAEESEHRGLRDAEILPDLARRFPGPVTLDQSVRVRREPFSGHVYNLETEDGYYVADSLVVSNCRGTVVSVGTVPEDQITGFQPVRGAIPV